MKKISFEYDSRLHIASSFKGLHFFFLTLSLLFFLGLSGQQTNIWYFGSEAGLDFNSSPAATLTNGALSTEEGCATIADETGNLLFYTDGRNVYNKNHQLMQNGTGLKGHSSSAQSAIIIPKPGYPSNYYIFTADASENKNAEGYNYSEVDMSLNNGLGAVISKNHLLFTPSTELLTAFRHANGIDVWIITKVWGNNEWRVFKIDCHGVSDQPVTSFIGTVYDQHNENSFYGSVGIAKATPNGKKLCVSRIGLNAFELFDFDNNTGLLSNNLIIQQDWAFGIEFSQDSKLLYVVSERYDGTRSRIYQYDLTDYNALAISNSAILIGESPIFTLMSGLQMAPDGKIYCTRLSQDKLAVINSPSTRGILSNFIFDYVDLKGRNAGRCFPSFFPNLVNNQNVGFSYNITPDCKTIEFKGSTLITGNVIWEWDFGDGTNGFGQEITHEYVNNSASNYTVLLTVKPTDICADEQRVVKEISFGKQEYLADINAETNCGSADVHFTATTNLAGATIQWEWDFGDGHTSGEQNPSHHYQQYGSYPVKLLVGRSGDCYPTVVFDSTITVYPKPVANFESSLGCNGKEVRFTDLSDYSYAAITSWQWTFENQEGSNEQNPEIIFKTTGIYDAQLIISADNGCVSDPMIIPITIHENPSISIEASQVCQGVPAFFNGVVNNSQEIQQWVWLFNGSETYNGQNAEYQFAASGEYEVQLSATSRVGCNADTVSHIVKVAPKPIVDFLVEDGCTYANISIKNLSSIASGNINTYEWSFGNGENMLGPSPTYQYNQSGYYNIQLKVISDKGCAAAPVEKTIKIAPSPLVDFNYNINCMGKPTEFINRSQYEEISSPEWRWNFGDNSFSSDAEPVHIYKSPGQFSVSLKATTIDGCVGESSQTIDIKNAIINAGKDTAVMMGKPFQLRASGADTYVWDPASFLNDPFSENPIATIERDISYRVTGTTTDGCIGYDTISIKAYKQADAYVPNAFNPNGRNKLFIPVLIGIRDLVELVVYNRWGMMVFKTNQPNVGWDGKFNNTDQPMGTYVWKLKAIDYEGNTLIKSGTITLIR